MRALSKERTWGSPPPFTTVFRGGSGGTKLNAPSETDMCSGDRGDYRQLSTIIALARFPQLSVCPNHCQICHRCTSSLIPLAFLYILFVSTFYNNLFLNLLWPFAHRNCTIRTFAIAPFPFSANWVILLFSTCRTLRKWAKPVYQVPNFGGPCKQTNKQ